MIGRHRVHAPGGTGLVGLNGPGSRGVRSHDRECAGALAVQAEVLRARNREQQRGHPPGDQSQAGGVRLGIVAEALVGEVHERNQAATLEEFRHRGPLGGIEVCAGRIVAAGMQQHDAARRQALQVLQQAIEVDGVRGCVEVGIAPQRQAGTANQRLVIRPRRIAHVDYRVRRGRTQQLGPDAQRTAASDSLDRSRAFLERRGEIGPERHLDDAQVELEVAGRSDVGLGRLRREQPALRLAHCGRDRSIAGLVAIHTDAEIDLPGIGIRAVGSRDAEDRVGRQCFESLEHQAIPGRLNAPERRAGRLRRRCSRRPVGASRFAHGHRSEGTA